MRAADLQQFGRGERVERSPVEAFEDLEEELRGEPFGELVFLFSRSADPLSTAGSRR